MRNSIMSWSSKLGGAIRSKDPFLVVLLALNSFLCVVVNVDGRPEGSVNQDGGISISSFPSQEAALQHFFLQQQQLAAAAAAAQGGHKAGKLPASLMEDVSYFDRVNVDSQLNNRRFVELQIKCLIYGGPCDIFGRKAKALLPSIILDNCRWCSPSQRTKLSRVIVHLQQHYPGAWSDALKKFGSSPKGFLTAGQAAPNNHAFFGKLPNETPDQVNQQQYVPPFPQIIYIQVPANNGTAPSADSHSEASSVAAHQASPAPEVIPAVESPTPFVEPTPGPRGYEITSSAEPPSTSAMESTISARSTTSRP